jgi:hypothetical protein|tara:strand:- start:481 stop:879 length:399 start_codon:yes stop_codon:yes gene_type:complete
LRPLNIDCKISAYCAINISEDVNKIQTAVSNVLIDMDGKISGNSFIANSNNYESLTKIYEAIRGKNSQNTYRRHLRSNMVKDSTWFYLNKQAAFVDVIAICNEADESPLGPIKIVLHSTNIEDVIEWLVSDT